MKNSISLYELNHQIARAVSERFASPVWVTAEIAQLGVASNGHCYLELIEKNANSGATTARCKAIIWANRWPLIKMTFEQGTGGQALAAGIKVLVMAQVTMHEAYGFSLTITDIEPTYTIGEMQRKRQEIIRRLTDEGMIDANRSLPLPSPTQKIAIISADTAAGYGDFCHQLANNEWGLHFYTHLFPAKMQGEQTEKSVIAALDRIYSHYTLFDAVVIIRGGGAVADLNSFDSYELALNIANFPLPVIVGIGHERDSTVLDVVANLSVKTPTAAAAFLIDRMADELSTLENLQNLMADALRDRMEAEQAQLKQFEQTVQGQHLSIGRHLSQLALMRERITMLARMRMEKEAQALDFIDRTIELSKPENILRRGFSITRLNGKTLTSAKTLHSGDIIETEMADGKVKAEVKFKQLIKRS
ncbi:MAG: exodeoxyribonuclease VII large subunit [Bacteroidales bacterium]|jgi:exodeoxyribonuclease VII large subunit|nr:exodeoxyribonuclease VII large subunit [Bacteroidales bacterium]